MTLHEGRTTWKTITIDAFETPNLEALTLEMLRDLPAGLPADHSIFTSTRGHIW